MSNDRIIRLGHQAKATPFASSASGRILAPFVGYGKSFASFGEVVQGRTSDGQDFLVTLPIDMWSLCELKCTPINGPLVVECRLEKSQAVLYHVLAALGIDRGYHLECLFTRNIPVGKGLSSSTADMLATLRAVQEVFGFLFTDSFISNLFGGIEPHDALHFNSSVAYNHRQGRLIENFGYIPRFTIIAVDGGGVVDTLSYNRTLTFSPDIMSRFDRLFDRLRAAYAARHDGQIAACATESARIHLERTGSDLLKKSFSAMETFSPLGIVATHSGTCVGFLYDREVGFSRIEKIADGLRHHFSKDVFVTRTLQLLA